MHESTAPPNPSRRTIVLAGLGLGLGGLGLGVGGLAGCSDTGQPRPVTGPEAATVARWVATRRAPYCIAHRGAGTVVPEHTLEGYRQALDWGAPCVEVSTALTSDGTLICLHDLTYDRTTTATGRVFDQSSAILDTARVRVPRLGPKWNGEHMPRIPTLDQALRTLGGRTVIALEAKDERGFDQMLDMVHSLGLTDSVIVKLFSRSTRIRRAQEAGFPVFVYSGGTDDLVESALNATIEGLRPDRDVLVLPTRVDGQVLADGVLSRAVGSGIPVWVYPLHRRNDADHFTRRGVVGFVTPDLGYLAGRDPVLTRDIWANGAITSGELTPNPYDGAYPLAWRDDALVVDYPRRPSFVCLGQFCPVARAGAGYRIDFDIRFETLPSIPTSHFSVAFGHGSDAPYSHRAGLSDGYHAVIRTNGAVELYAHRRGVKDGMKIGRTSRTPALRAGQWVTMSLAVDPSMIRWARVGHPTVEVRDNRFRGGYLHVGRSAPDGPLAIRRFTIRPNVL